jgi:competence protein ComEA
MLHARLEDQMFRMFAVAAVLSCLAGSALAQTSGQGSAARSDKAPVPVNLNSATISQLQTLPGIGAKTAERIVQYREKNGPFKKVEELMNVQGVGEKTFLRLKPQLTLAAKSGSSPEQQ